MSETKIIENWYASFEYWYASQDKMLAPKEMGLNGFQAGYDAAMREMAEMEPVAWVFQEPSGNCYALSFRGGAGQVPLIIRPTIKGE